MTVELGIVLALLVAAILMFASNRPRSDYVAALMMAALPFSGVVTAREAIAGFADPNVVLIALLFVLGEGLVRTGVAQRLGDLLSAHTAGSEARLIIFLMITVATIGSVMSSTGVVAIFIPIVLRIAHKSSIRPSRLMMPLSVAALISGMMTLVGTAPNLVVQGELARASVPGFRFFSFTPFGIPLLIVAIGYMLVARKWLEGHTIANEPSSPRRQLAHWIEEYSLHGRAYRLRIADRSPLIGKTLQELDLRSASGVNIIAIEQSGRFARQVARPLAQTSLHEGEVLFIDTQLPSAEIDAFIARHGLENLPLATPYFSDQSQEIGMAEVMIPADSHLVDKTVVQAAFRTRYDLTVIGLKHGKTPFRGGVLTETLRIGDTLLVAGPWRAIRKLSASTSDLLLLDLPAEVDDVVPAASRAPFAVGSLLLVVVLMVTGVVPNVQAALIGCLLMGLFGCVDFNSAYRSIHWPSLVLIVGMIPFSIALQKTGGIAIAAEAIASVADHVSPRLLLVGIFFVTAVLGMFMSNTATAILMAPVALAVAKDLNLSPYPFAMTVALASSSAFMTPVSSPVNTLVVGPGDYTFWDFVKVGVPLTILAVIVVVLLVPLLLPMTP